jgi:leucyl aminopeptidase
VYTRDASGVWSWFAEGPILPPSASYALATYTTPPMPSGATAISVGLSLVSLGTLTVDAHELVDLDVTDTLRPYARVASPAAAATVSGIAPIVAEVSDNVGVYRVRFYRDGVQLGTRVTPSTFRWNWDTATTTNGAHTLEVQAEDAAGNVMRSATITVTVAN